MPVSRGENGVFSCLSSYIQLIHVQGDGSNLSIYHSRLNVLWSCSMSSTLTTIQAQSLLTQHYYISIFYFLSQGCVIYIMYKQSIVIVLFTCFRCFILTQSKLQKACNSNSRFSLKSYFQLILVHSNGSLIFCNIPVDLICIKFSVLSPACRMVVIRKSLHRDQ